jgi:battenin
MSFYYVSKLQLVYQSTVFLSRSSISFGLPAIPERLLPMPAVVQLFILIALAFESGVGLIPANNEGAAIMFVFFMISVEGICGGLA